MSTHISVNERDGQRVAHPSASNKIKGTVGKESAARWHSLHLKVLADLPLSAEGGVAS